MKRSSRYLSCSFFLFLVIALLPGIAQETPPVDLSGRKADGYKGIWFTLGQFYPYGDKYSGGLGTYTAKHIPGAVCAVGDGRRVAVPAESVADGARVTWAGARQLSGPRANAAVKSTPAISSTKGQLTNFGCRRIQRASPGSG